MSLILGCRRCVSTKDDRADHTRRHPEASDHRPGRSCYPVLNFSASTTNAERWLAGHPEVRGRVISMPEAIAAGPTMFGKLLKEV
jgi:hypothetical protein